MRVNFRTYGVPPQEFFKNLTFQFISVKEGLKFLGEQTKVQMRRNISETKTRGGSRNNLENSINVYVEEHPGSFLVGVGKIDDLNMLAPYWRVVNYGAFIPAGGKTIYGSFEGGQKPDEAFAGTGVGKDAFYLSRFGTQNTFAMTPKHPIAPKNYIEKTFNWLNSIVRVHLSGVINKTQSFKIIQK